MRVSIVDLSAVPPGGTATDAFDNSVALARQADAQGFHRYWVAEHHGMGSAIAGTCPEVLVARLASATTRIRVGSGTVLLNYSRPLRVAETFRSLHAMFPGRIDLGLGRAAGYPVVDAALRAPVGYPDSGGSLGDLGGGVGDLAGLGGGVGDLTGLGGGVGDLAGLGGGLGGPLDGLSSWMTHEGDVAEVLNWLDGRFGVDDPRSDVRLAPGVAGGPEPWLLGSSPTSAMLAGRLGLRYGFAAFFNPQMATPALRMYRASFRPSSSPGGLEAPWSMLAVNVCCADTDTEAARLRSTVELFYQRGGFADRAPLVDPGTAVTELGALPDPFIAPGSWPRHLSGGPTHIRANLEQMLSDTGADELMVQDLIADPVDRLHSYELLAEAFELRSPASPERR